MLAHQPALRLIPQFAFAGRLWYAYTSPITYYNADIHADPDGNTHSHAYSNSYSDPNTHSDTGACSGVDVT